MSDSILSKATRRLSQARNMLTGKTQDPTSLPWDPESTSFPLRKDLPVYPGALEGSAWVWGRDDYRGRLNLLTPTRVKAASASIVTGETARLDLPLDHPNPPAFGRQKFEHNIITIAPGKIYDDTYNMNTQSSTQWDGFRHCCNLKHGLFYNHTRGSDFDGETDTLKCSIHHWSSSGFAGRAVFLDYRAYAETQGITYDTASHHQISYDELTNCGKHQGLDIRPASQGGDIQIGDILLIRIGWTKDYHTRTPDQNAKVALRKNTSDQNNETFYAGLKQEEAIFTWLHDCYFAAVGGDSPTFEAWPSKTGTYLHEYILAMWGMPLGEMLDLEKVSEIAKKNRQYTFFFTSAPANCVGGVSSGVNGTAIF